jgi:membrane protein DedA with SNARE-associated domain
VEVSAIEWWLSLAAASKAAVEQHELLAGSLFLLADEAGVPTPIPGNLLIVLLGVRASQGAVSLWAVVAAMEVVTVIGATILYTVSRWGGRPLVNRFGRYAGITPARLAPAEAWVRRRGMPAVVLARLIPGFRIVTAIAAGLLAVPPSIFIPGMSVGALIYIVACVGIGYALGPPALAWLERLPLPLHL